MIGFSVKFIVERKNQTRILQKHDDHGVKKAGVINLQNSLNISLISNSSL
jgi:hypothetical protein